MKNENVCKYISCCGCIYLIFVILLLPVVIYVTRSTPQLETISRDTHLKRKYNHFGDQFFDSGVSEILERMEESNFFPRNHLRSNVLPYISNDTHDVCENPFENMCHVGKKVESLQESTEKYNEELIEEVERKELLQTDFVKTCIKFHSEKNQRGTIESVLKSRLVRSQFEIVDALKDHIQLENTLGQLFRFGTRLLISITYQSLDEESPLHANRIATPVSFKRAPRILSGYHCRNSGFVSECIQREKKILEMILKFVYSERLSIDNAMEIEAQFPSYSDDWNGLEVYSKEELEKLNVEKFRFKEYLQRLEESPFEWDNFLVDSEFVMEFQDIAKRNTIAQWKNYLKIGILYQVMLHLRIGGSGAPAELIFRDDAKQTSNQMLTPQIVCIKQYEQLFPYHVCHAIKKTMALDTFPIKQIFRRIRTTYMQWIDKEAERTLGIRNKALVSIIKETLKDLQLVVDHCWLFRDESKKKFFDDFESEILEWMNHQVFKEGDYIDIIHHILRQKIPTDKEGDKGGNQIMMFRNYWLDRQLRDLVSTFMSWGGWYSPRANALVVPSGLVHFILKKLEKDHCISESFGSYFLSHETSHLVQNIIESQWKFELESKDYVISENDSLRLWNGKMSNLSQESHLHRDSLHFSEFVADWLGIPVSYETLFLASGMDTKIPKRHEKRCFYATIFRLWCRDKCMNNHPCDRIRALMTIKSSMSMKSYFEDIYKCRSSIKVYDA